MAHAETTAASEAFAALIASIIEPSIKVETLLHLAEKKLLSRTIYNSIHIGITKEEIQALQCNTPAMVIAVAFNPKDKSPDGKIEVLENGAHLIESGLLEIAHQLDIEKILVTLLHLLLVKTVVQLSLLSL